MVIIQCSPGGKKSPKVGEAKAPCKFCQKMLPELKNSKGEGMDSKIGLDAGGNSAAELQKKCKAGGKCKGK